MRIEIIRKHYATLPDSKIRELADDVLNLTADGKKVLEEEIAKRSLPLTRTIANVINDQAEIEKLIGEKCAMIRDQPCPLCGTEEYKLNGITLSTVTFINATTAFYIGCYNCLMDKKHKATNKNTMFNLRGFSGIKEADQSLKDNERAVEELKIDKPSSSLWNFVAAMEQEQFKKTMIEINVHVQNKPIR
jgi:hypothetical protein